MDFNLLYLKISILEMDDVLQNPHLNETCRRLSFGLGYGMTRFLDFYGSLFRERSIDACAIMAYYLHNPVGWALFSYESDRIEFRKREGEAVCHFFVQESWRRYGIGTRLIDIASKMASPDTLKVYAHENYKFFDPFIQQYKNVEAI
jgi:GNAT superfamily N-acetyltransferase